MGVTKGGLWAGIAVAAALLAMLLAVADLGIDPASASRPLLLTLVGIAGALGRQWARSTREARFAELAECWGAMTLVCTIGALASYGVTRLTTGQVDAWLAGIDRAMGYDWIAAYRFVAERPWLARIGELAYQSIFFSPMAVLAGLVLSGRAARGRALIAAFGIALAIGLAIFVFCPARGALDYHIGTDIPYMPATGISHLAATDQLRSGEMRMIDVSSLSGMISFPSFHAVAAILFIWAAWPLAWLRWPTLAVNLTMLSVTPVQGVHYLIDVIAGVVLALAAIGLLHLRVPRLGWRPLRAPSRPAFD